MIAVVDLETELGKLTMLEGRTPTSTAAERETSSARLAPYRDGAIFISKFSGTGAWERHPQGDEIVHILDGETLLRLAADEGLQALNLKAGMMAIVPRGMWHQFVAPNGVSLMTATPLPTEHITADVDDPRTVDAKA
ncbi:MAG: cupin domain-containing protein [Alphaproteobacteria bacterium]|nr:cupin domain-containing protein [Alphaproteobacteria bacterium]